MTGFGVECTNEVVGKLRSIILNSLLWENFSNTLRLDTGDCRPWGLVLLPENLWIETPEGQDLVRDFSTSTPINSFVVPTPDQITRVEVSVKIKICKVSVPSVFVDYKSMKTGDMYDDEDNLVTGGLDWVSSFELNLWS